MAGDYLNLAEVLQRAGNFTEAEQSYRRSQELFEALVTDFPAVLHYQQYMAECRRGLARLLQQQGRVTEALPVLRKGHELYRRLADESQQSPAFRRWLAEVRADLVWLLVIDFGLDHRGVTEAIRLAEQSVVEDPSQSRPHEMLAAARYRAGNFAGAVASMNKSLELEPRENADLFWLALAYGRLGDKERARSYYDRAVGWVDANASRDRQLARLRAEAAALLGVTVHLKSPDKEETTTHPSTP